VSGRLLVAAEVAELLGGDVSEEWVWAQSRAGKIPTVRIGRRYRYRRESIEQWISGLERASVDVTSQMGRHRDSGPPPA
jgi:excisionase family DNA binding protein